MFFIILNLEDFDQWTDMLLSRYRDTLNADKSALNGTFPTDHVSPLERAGDERKRQSRIR